MSRYGRGILAAAALAPVLATACSGDPDHVGGTAAPVGAPVTTSAAVTSGAVPTATAGSPGSPVASTGTPEPTGRTASPTARSSESPVTDRLAPGGYDVLIKSVDAGQGSISVDVVDYMTGAAAVQACRQDGGHGSGESCASGYVRNTPTPVRTVMVAGNAKITMSIAITAQPSTLEQVAAGLPARNLYSMRMGYDSISTLDEIYRP